MIRRVAVAGAVLAVLASACSSEGTDVRSGPRLIPLAGPVSLLRGEDVVEVSEPLSLAPGDTVRSGAGTGARIEWSDGHTLEIAPHTELTLGDAAPELVAGSLLVESTGSLMIRAGAAQIEGAAGIFRLDRDVNLRVGVYAGVATIPGPGLDDEVSALRQAIMEAVSGTLAGAPEPLEIDPRDPWDARLLGSAIDLGLRLADLQRGLAAQLRGSRDVVIAVLNDDLPRATLEDLLNRSPAADLVVAAQAALLAARTTELSPVVLLENILSFRAEGASWPVVVAAWDLQRADLIAAVSRLTEIITGLLRPALGGPGGPGPGFGPGGTTPIGPGGGPGTEGGTPGNDPPNEGSDPPRPPNPPDPPPPPPEPECEGTVDCLVDDVLDVSTDLSTS